MARILWLSTEVPDRDGQGGQRRQYHQIRSLLRLGHSIDVIVPRSPQDDGRIAELVRVRRPRIVFLRRVSHIRLRRLRSRFRSAEWDAIIVSHTDAIGLLPPASTMTTPVLVDVHNVMSHWHATADRTEEAESERARESEAVTRASAITTCSEEELRRLVALHPEAAPKSFAAPLGVDPDEWPDVALPRTQPIVALFGSWGWLPNRRGLQWFAAEVWPRVRSVVPDGRALVAGTGISDDLEMPAGMDAVGRVDDLAGFTGEATVVAVPVREGVGAAVKFAEALASGAAVIATTDGANAFDESPALVSDDAEVWAEWIAERLIRRGDEPAPNPARAYALEHLTWAAAVLPVDRWLRAVTRHQGRNAR